MKIKLNIDKTPHKEKPKGAEVGAIRNRLANGSAEIEPQELTAIIENGGSFTPALMTGTSGDSWQSQQIIVADIDNGAEKPISSKRAAILCAAVGITPYYIYRTFSNSSELEKYRIVLILDEPITDKAEAENITRRFANLFNTIAPGAADTTMGDAARLIYGSYKGSVIVNSGSITPLEVVRELPEIQPKQTAPEPRQEPAKYEAPRKDRRYDDIKAQRRYDIETFDLRDYIMQTERPQPREHTAGNTTFLNPCPICGHNDDFVVNGHLWHCLGQHGDIGGTIIDYIINRENKTLQEALKKFDSMMNYEEPTPEPIKEDPAPEQEAAKDNRDDLTKFFEVIQTEAYKPHPTGLKFFDNLLDGGIVNQSLLLLLAAPAAGKTTLVQQIAEEMAKNKNPIIYINFEMSREQMLAKAISAKYYRNGGNKTALEVLRGYEWSDDDRTGLAMIVDEYRRNNYPYIRYNPDGVTSEIHGLLKYLTAIGNATKAGQQAPAIVVDYLHLITSNEKTDDAELIKQTVIGLKDYAKKYNTFVIGIIASNRASNKSGRLTMESGRDSSNLEYTGDYILSLNYEEIDNGKIKPNSTKDDINEKLEKLYNRDKRPMILRVLKNRFGRQGKSRKLLFNAPYNIFYDGDDKAIPPAGFILDDGAPAFED